MPTYAFPHRSSRPLATSHLHGYGPRIGCIATRTPPLPCLISFHLVLQLYHLSWYPVYELIHEEQRRKKPKMSTERQYQNETKRDEKTKTNCRSVTPSNRVQCTPSSLQHFTQSSLFSCAIRPPPIHLKK